MNEIMKEDFCISINVPFKVLERLQESHGMSLDKIAEEIYVMSGDVVKQSIVNYLNGKIEEVELDD